MARQMLSVRDDKITAVHSFLSKISTASREIKHSFFTGARDENLSILLSLVLRRNGEVMGANETLFHSVDSARRYICAKMENYTWFIQSLRYVGR